MECYRLEILLAINMINPKGFNMKKRHRVQLKRASANDLHFVLGH